VSALDVYAFSPSKPAETVWTEEGGRVAVEPTTGATKVRHEWTRARYENRHTVRFPPGTARELREFLHDHRLGFLFEDPDRSYSEVSERFAYTGTGTFALSRKFIKASTVVVTVDGAPESDWTLSGNNTVPLITPGGTFPNGAVVVTYRHYYQVQPGPIPLRSQLLVPGAKPALVATVEVFEIQPGGHLA
jgi:hypothetical protein